MRLVFLGTGTSSGVPAIACTCAVCRSSDPRDTRTRTSAALLIPDPDAPEGPIERVVLLDCGPDFREQALRHGLTRCDAVLFTHNHVDHTWGVDELRRFNAVMDRPIPVFAERHTLDFLASTYRHIFDRSGNVNDSFVATLVPHELTCGVPIELYGLRITPVRLHHGRLAVLGFRIEHADPRRTPQGTPLPMGYCTDVSSIPPETWPHLGGLRTLVLDALRHRAHPTHFTLSQAVEAADRIGAGQTWFVHMSHELPHAETNAALPAGMGLAWDGLELPEHR